MDEALWLPTEKAVRLALRTQQIIAYESGVADTIDPLAGSYVLEYLTDEIENRALEYLHKIDEMGGAQVAIEGGYIQREIQDSAYRSLKELERGDQILVGVNAFKIEETISLERLKVDPAIEAAQCRRLAELRSRRESEKVSQMLSTLERAAVSDENLIPIFIESVEHDVTLGEICNVLRHVWGEYQPPTTF
jgi:methylmalonyl-CoA mutase, N-terminal domain